MQRAVRAASLIILCCAAAYVTLDKVLTDARRVEAQQAVEEGLSRQAAGKYAEAVPFFERALEAQEAALGKEHPGVATALDHLASLYMDQGLYARAEPLYQRALDIREAAYGRDHPEVAASLTILASLYTLQGLYARAEPLYQRALDIREASLGKDHPEVAVSLNNLASLYTLQRLYERAEPLYRRALGTQEAALGKDDTEVAASLNRLANLYTLQGLYGRAEPLYECALEIQQAALGKDSLAIAGSLKNLAILYMKQGFYARAELLGERALTRLEVTRGNDHPSVTLALDSLASLYMKQGLYARAEPLYQRALDIREASLGRDHPEVATALDHLASLYAVQKLYERAEPLHRRALGIREASLGKEHPDIADTLHKLAWLHLARSHLDEALPLLDRAFELSEEHLRQEVYGYSEARLANLLLLLRDEEELLYTLAGAHPGDFRVRRLALSAALLRKGRSVEEVSNTSRIIYRSLGQADRDTFERLRALRTQLSNLSLAGPGPLSPSAYQQRLKELADQGDALEADLARRSAPLRSLHALPPPSKLIASVADALPKDSALVELVAYHRDEALAPVPGAPASQAPNQLRYLALLLFADGRTQAIDLGLAEPINRAALHLHDALAGQRDSHEAAAQELYTLAFRPLVPLLGEVRRLFLSPDGQLSLVPFAALHDGSHFLVDDWDITYLTSGKELLRRFDDLPLASSVVVLADPAFGSSPAAPSQATEAGPVVSERSAALDRFFSNARADLGDRPWPPLPGTRKEAEAIQKLLPQAQLLLGSSATKDALLKLPTPGLLHIATHGFFLEDAPTSQAGRSLGSIGAIVDTGPLYLPPDPLLRSGLVLGGTGAPKAPPSSRHLDDSLVTALELAGLDLWGTQLVVLSACDTGRGDVRLGQGVYGMRRALTVAGAQTLVTSLWKVDDSVTSELMAAYYKNLLKGLGRTTALRQAMLELRHKHPHFWAPFIALGLDTPLQGLAPQ